MEKNSEKDLINYQKDEKNFDLKVNINKKRENSINQLLSLIPGNEFINKKRKKNIGFIYACQFGFMSFIFTDFGDNFMVLDKNGKKCQEYYIKSISNSCPGIVEIDPIEIVDKDKKKKKILKLKKIPTIFRKSVSASSSPVTSISLKEKILSKI